MRLTLRRSCDACAKSKLSCDLRTPQCSRCTKKNTLCIYANQPLTTSPPELQVFDRAETTFEVLSPPRPLGTSYALRLNSIDCSVDPFDTYPRTKLVRAHEQRLIQHFLSNIAFQYYPLDLDASSNPFIVSWWPLALSDPALFHVSLQTASLDVDLHDRKGFANSEILMADSVSLVRKRVEDPSLAIQDATMDSVVTLAAIEFGKGNADIGKMHIDGIVNMVLLRGGIQQVKLTSPLTARMVSWVSLILTQCPQFSTQDDHGLGSGIAPISPWIALSDASRDPKTAPFHGLGLDETSNETLWRLRELLHGSKGSNLSTTDFHDLTCFVLHRLLVQSPLDGPDYALESLSASACTKKGAVLYLLIIHGPTYFSHTFLQQSSVSYLRVGLEASLSSFLLSHPFIALWLLSIGMVSSEVGEQLQWFTDKATEAATFLNLSTWEEIFACLRMVFWFDSWRIQNIFRDRWAMIIQDNNTT